MKKPHPKLIPLLDKYDLSYEMFHKQGRPPKGVKAKRESIVTELHESGMSWEEMALVTGKTTSFIQRNTKAVGNPASHLNRVESARKVGASRKGEKKPWLSEAMKMKWKHGDFDFHIGRERSADEIANLRAAWESEELKKATSERMTALWKDDDYRSNLLKFHRSPEERLRRSKLQIARLQRNPQKWTRGNGSYVTVTKCTGKRKVWVRSSYEKAAVRILEQDPLVVSYEYEARITLPSGKWILPDFLITYVDGSRVLVEVKAAWVLKLKPDHPQRIRLKLAREAALKKGFGFEIWTENTRLSHVI